MTVFRILILIALPLVTPSPWTCEVGMKGYHIHTTVQARSEGEAVIRARKRYPQGTVRYCIPR
jgi:hypothetical protein